MPRTNKRRDPTAPKRNLSAYLLYQNAMRDTFKERHPEMDFGQLSQYTAAMFAEMPHAEKVMWHMRSKEDKNRYQKELAAYKPQPGYDAKGDITEAGAILLGISLNKGKGSRSRNRRKKGAMGAVTLPGGGVIRRSIKSKRDHNFPKRNLSAFLLYQNYMRHVLKNNNGHPIITSDGGIDSSTTISSFGDIATYSSQTFKKLSPEEKAYWDQLAEDDKNRFQKQLSQYKPSPGYDQNGNLIDADEEIATPPGLSVMGGANQPTSAAALALAIKNSVHASNSVIKKRRKRAPRDSSAPKRSSGAYVFFTNDMRPIIWKQQPNLKFVELGKVLGQKWRALTPEERAPYEKMAEEDKARYQREIKAYNEKRDLEEKDEKQEPMDYNGVMGGVDMMTEVPALSPNNDPRMSHAHGVQSSPNVHAYAEHIHVQSPSVSESNHVVGADGAYGYGNVSAAGAVGESDESNMKKEGLEDGYYAA